MILNYSIYWSIYINIILCIWTGIQIIIFYMIGRGCNIKLFLIWMFAGQVRDWLTLRDGTGVPLATTCGSGMGRDRLWSMRDGMRVPSEQMLRDGTVTGQRLAGRNGTGLKNQSRAGLYRLQLNTHSIIIFRWVRYCWTSPCHGWDSNSHLKCAHESSTLCTDPSNSIHNYSYYSYITIHTIRS